MTEAPGPRDRMLVAAVDLIRRQGVSGTGMRQIVDRAGAPRGSLQHYFPGGKDQLVGEAVRQAGAHVAGLLARYAEDHPRATPGDLFAAMVQWWRENFRVDGFGPGCPLAATVVDAAAGSPALRTAGRDALDAWRLELRRALVGRGVPTRRADRLAVVMMSAIEGALVLARSAEDTGPLDAVLSELRPVFDAAAGPDRVSSRASAAAARPATASAGRGCSPPGR